MNTRVFVGIPARMGSSRFPGKPLKEILGKSMIQRIFENVEGASRSTFTFVATCDEEIESHLAEFKIPTLLTSKDINRPGQRVAEACKNLDLSPNDIVIVVQGDEPLVTAAMVDAVIELIINSQEDKFIFNLCAPATHDQLHDPNEVKVVLDKLDHAMYFSRSPIPSSFHIESPSSTWRQVCIFGFRWEFMQYFYDELDATPLEKHESIELLRALESGIKVRMLPIYEETKSVDTYEDLIEVEKILRDRP